MIKRKISSFILLCLILFIISFQYITVVKGLTESFTDPQNDIFRIDYQNEVIEKVSSHDEIDIVNITLDGQYTNVSFAGNITGYDIECDTYFFEHYNPNSVIFEYGVHYSNLTGTGFKVIFIKYIPPEGDEYSYEFWNNTIGWTSFNISADSIGNFSDYSIEAEIPENALTINDNITWFVISRSVEGYNLYVDCAPDSYCPIEVTDGFDYRIIVFIAIIAFVGIGAFYLYKKRKPKQNSFP